MFGRDTPGPTSGASRFQPRAAVIAMDARDAASTAVMNVGADQAGNSQASASSSLTATAARMRASPGRR